MANQRILDRTPANFLNFNVDPGIAGFNSLGGVTNSDWSGLAGYGQPASSNYADSLMPSLAGNVTTGVNMGSGGGAGNWFTDLLDNSGALNRKLANGDTLQGWGSLGLGAVNGLMSGWMGMQQLGVAKDTLAQNKRQFDLNYAAQQKTTNASLADRQASRVASNPGAYQSVGDYMKKYGI